MTEFSKDPLRVGKRLRQGDLRALDDLLRLGGPAVLGRLRRRFDGILSVEDLEEVVADALNAAWRYRERFDPEKGSVFTWFYAISLNAAIDLTRAKKREPVQVSTGREIEAFTEGAASVDLEDIPPPAAVVQVVREIIDALPSDQREIILADLKYFPEVAPSKSFGDLGIKPGYVPVYRDRAHKKIRAELTKRGFRLDVFKE